MGESDTGKRQIWWSELDRNWLLTIRQSAAKLLSVHSPLPPTQLLN